MLLALRRMISTPTRVSNLNSTEAGLTLIECLVAIIVIALTTATIAPMVVFAVATRVQNQKTEQALQLAQAEIDKIKLIVDQGGDYGDRLIDINLPIASTPTTVEVGAPTSFIPVVNTTNEAVTATKAREVDIDGDNDADFAIQLFRTQGIEVSPQTPGVVADTPVVFDVGVRVYDARARSNLSSLQTEEAGLAFTSGEGDRGLRPLAVLYGQIAQGDRDGSLCQYWEFTGTPPDDLQC